MFKISDLETVPYENIKDGKDVRDRKRFEIEQGLIQKKVRNRTRFEIEPGSRQKKVRNRRRFETEEGSK